MKIHLFLLFQICILTVGCSEENTKYKIIRFDTDLYQYLTNNAPDSVLEAHADFLNLLGEKVIHIGQSDSAGFYVRLKAYFSEPALQSLYRDEQAAFSDSDIEALNHELSAGLSLLLKQMPKMKPPKKIYLHVSGFNQNIIVTDDILSLSADKYLGADYLLYKRFFHDYQRQQMNPDRIVPDYLLGFMMANLPFQGNEDILLDRMLYEGKLRYILSLLLPNRKAWEYVGYNEQQYAWCNNSRSQIWKTILENQHLFTANYQTTSRYLKEAPATAFLPAESPGRVGVWLGYQIVKAYMKQKPDTDWQSLMEMTDYRELLKESKYKP